MTSFEIKLLWSVTKITWMNKFENGNEQIRTGSVRRLSASVDACFVTILHKRRDERTLVRKAMYAKVNERRQTYQCGGS